MHVYTRGVKHADLLPKPHRQSCVDILKRASRRCDVIGRGRAARRSQHLVLEKVIVQIAFETAGEGGAGRRPFDAVRELQRLPRRQRMWLLAGQVHLDDLRPPPEPSPTITDALLLDRGRGPSSVGTGTRLGTYLPSGES